MLGVRADAAGDLSGANGNMVMHQFDDVGAILVNPEGRRLTYSCSITGIVAAAAATDIFVLGGSASAVIKVSRVEFAATAGTAVVVDASLILRSVADTVGTFVTGTVVAHDQNDAVVPADVVCGKYTANPTTGTAIGHVRDTKYFANLTTAAPDVAVYEFGNRPGSKALVLRGVAQQLALNLNGATISTPSFDVYVEFEVLPTTA